MSDVMLKGSVEASEPNSRACSPGLKALEPKAAPSEQSSLNDESVARALCQAAYATDDCLLHGQDFNLAPTIHRLEDEVRHEIELQHISQDKVAKFKNRLVEDLIYGAPEVVAAAIEMDHDGARPLSNLKERAKELEHEGKIVESALCQAKEKLLVQLIGVHDVPRDRSADDGNDDICRRYAHTYSNKYLVGVLDEVNYLCSDPKAFNKIAGSVPATFASPHNERPGLVNWMYVRENVHKPVDIEKLHSQFNRDRTLFERMNEIAPQSTESSARPGQSLSDWAELNREFEREETFRRLEKRKNAELYMFLHIRPESMTSVFGKLKQ
jgi:hypothetical protein